MYVAASLSSSLTASKGGVAAKSPSPGPVLNSLATNLERYTGHWLSPLLMSIHFVSTILMPRLRASERGIRDHTFLPCTWANSVARASATMLGTSSWPLTSSHACCQPESSSSGASALISVPGRTVIS